MNDHERPIRAETGPVVVTLPDEIDMSNAKLVGRELRAAEERP
jgi:hypothetical protein